CARINFFSKRAAASDTYTLSLPDALPIWRRWDFDHLHGKEMQTDLSNQVIARIGGVDASDAPRRTLDLKNILTTELGLLSPRRRDRKSTRLNSSHVKISYAVFCLKKKQLR